MYSTYYYMLAIFVYQWESYSTLINYEYKCGALWLAEFLNLLGGNRIFTDYDRKNINQKWISIFIEYEQIEMFSCL